MKLEVGMYLRFEGKINKIIEIEDDDIVFYDNWYDHWLDDVSRMNVDRFIKDYKPIVSFNIIDLIKSKDIILGRDGKIYQCWKIYKDYVFTYSKNKQGQTITLVDYQIDKILTKEQFEQMSYKVGD